MNKLKDLHYWKISWLLMKQRKQRALCDMFKDGFTPASNGK